MALSTCLTLDSLPVEVIDEYCDPQIKEEVQHASRLLMSAQKELFARLSVCLNEWSRVGPGRPSISRSMASAFLPQFMQFLELHSELKVEQQF